MQDEYSISENYQYLQKCYICMFKIKDAAMCVKCQKLACHSCLSKWFKSNKKCPHCRETLNESDLIKLRFFSDIANILDNTINNQCDEHSLQLIYYCTYCKVSACSDCIIFSQSHKTHIESIKKLDLIYNEHYNLIKSELNNLETKKSNLTSNLKTLENKIISINESKDVKLREIELFFDHIRSKFDKTISNSLLKLLNSKSQTMNKVDLIDGLKNEVDHEIGNLTKNNLVMKTDSIITKLKNISIDTNIKDNCSIDLPDDILPKYEKYSFLIENLNQINEEVIYSSLIKFYSIEWRIKLYPKGNGAFKGDYISLFLELVSGINDQPETFEYKIEILNNFDERNNITSFYINDFKDGESWGSNKFYKIKDCLNPEHGFLNDQGNLHINLFIRHKRYLSFCNNMRNYIKSLESNNHNRNSNDCLIKLIP